MELWVELHVIPPIFHPQFHHTQPTDYQSNNSQKGGRVELQTRKKYFSENRGEKVVTTQVGLPYSYYDETIAA